LRTLSIATSLFSLSNVITLRALSIGRYHFPSVT
jgi:hypothetical protein